MATPVKIADISWPQSTVVRETVTIYFRGLSSFTIVALHALLNSLAFTDSL